MIDIRKKPTMELTDAQVLASKYYGLDCIATELPSERDQNFLLVDSDGQKYVLKIANPSEDPLVLLFENQVLDHVAKRESRIPIPRVLRTLSGLAMEKETRANGEAYCVRLLTFLQGKPMALAKPHTPALLRELGNMLSRLDRAMADLWNPVAKRPLTWSVFQAAGIVGKYASDLDTWEQRSIVSHFLTRFETFTMPLLPGVPHGLIHNDGNDYNILVRELSSGEIGLTGLLDFGDLIWGPYIYEPAVVASYAILDEPDPTTIAGQILAGYHDISPLGKKEIELFLDLITIRLSTSVVLAAHQRKVMPGNEYLSISERPAWATLEGLITLDPSKVREHFLNVCNYKSDHQELN